MDDNNKTHETTMEEIKTALQQLLFNASTTHGNPSNSTLTIKVVPITMVLQSRGISLGFPHFDGSSCKRYFYV